jgi:hypothetical protein
VRALPSVSDCHLHARFPCTWRPSTPIVNNVLLSFSMPHRNLGVRLAPHMYDLALLQPLPQQPDLQAPQQPQEHPQAPLPRLDSLAVGSQLPQQTAAQALTPMPEQATPNPGLLVHSAARADRKNVLGVPAENPAGEAVQRKRRKAAGPPAGIGGPELASTASLSLSEQLEMTRRRQAAEAQVLETRAEVRRAREQQLAILQRSRLAAEQPAAAQPTAAGLLGAGIVSAVHQPHHQQQPLAHKLEQRQAAEATQMQQQAFGGQQLRPSSVITGHGASQLPNAPLFPQPIPSLPGLAAPVQQQLAHRSTSPTSEQAAAAAASLPRRQVQQVPVPPHYAGQRGQVQVDVRRVVPAEQHQAGAAADPFLDILADLDFSALDSRQPGAATSHHHSLPLQPRTVRGLLGVGDSRSLPLAAAQAGALASTSTPGRVQADCFGDVPLLSQMAVQPHQRCGPAPQQQAVGPPPPLPRDVPDPVGKRQRLAPGPATDVHMASLPGRHGAPVGLALTDAPAARSLLAAATDAARLPTAQTSPAAGSLSMSSASPQHAQLPGSLPAPASATAATSAGPAPALQGLAGADDVPSGRAAGSRPGHPSLAAAMLAFEQQRQQGRTGHHHEQQ